MTSTAITTPGLSALGSAHAAPGMLTAYVAFPDGTMPSAMPLVLRRELAGLRTTIEGASHDERESFDEAAEQLLDALQALGPHAPAGTWMGVATRERVLHDEWLERVLPTLVAWSEKPRIAPFLAAHQSADGVIALVDRHHAVLLRLEGESLTEVDRWVVDARPLGEPSHMSAPASPGFHHGTAGTAGADVVARRSDLAAEKNLARAHTRIRAHAGRDRVVVLGGSRESVARLRNELETEFGSRLLIADSLEAGATMSETRAAALRLIARWRAARTDEAVDDALARAASPLVAVGDDAVELALAEAAVSLLIVAESRLGEQGERGARVESLVRRALGQRARVEVAEGASAERLVELAGGSVALRRFGSVPAPAEN